MDPREKTKVRSGDNAISLPGPFRQHEAFRAFPSDHRAKKSEDHDG